ncbi:hypothetical protein QN277_008660 [Acacia crassicarpa]|uniref:Uncharacterized protein n=1 Tax=Acacia crassicarpa TaxID=499986 RepID=A0AAE1JM93_9FABA|nr:hypothetical protein QN277_008660 [Acacia crassicarpa]
MAFLPCVLLLTNLLLLFFLPLASSATSINAITQSQPLLDDGRTTLVSKDGKFKLGYFGSGSKSNRYIGIWFKAKPVRTVVRAANRENAIKHSSGS